LHGRQCIEQFFEIIRWVDAEFAAGFHKAVDDCAGLARVGTAEEQEVLFTDGGRADGVFDEVVVDLERCVFEVQIQCVPALERIGDGIAEVALWQLAGLLFVVDFLFSYSRPVH